MQVHNARMIQRQKFMLFTALSLLAYILLMPSGMYAETTPVSPSAQIITSTPSYKNVDYTLPYPGLLPDSPLYPLKAFRDKLISMFISDPLQKAKFDLLQTDKRVNSSIYLFNRKHRNENLITTTISKGENYFEEGIGQIRQAKMQGQSNPDIIHLFSKASQKHIELIREMEVKVTGAFKKDLHSSEIRMIDLEKTVDSMKK